MHHLFLNWGTGNYEMLTKLLETQYDNLHQNDYFNWLVLDPTLITANIKKYYSNIATQQNGDHLSIWLNNKLKYNKMIV